MRNIKKGIKKFIANVMVLVLTAVSVGTGHLTDIRADDAPTGYHYETGVCNQNHKVECIGSGTEFFGCCENDHPEIDRNLLCWKEDVDYYGYYCPILGQYKKTGYIGKTVTGLCYFSHPHSPENSGQTSGSVYCTASGSNILVPNTYTLTFSLQNGTADSFNASVTYGSNACWDLASYNPSVDGYTFLGWATSAQTADDMKTGTTKGTLVYGDNGKCIKGTSYWDNSGNFCNGTLTNGSTYYLYAQWKMNGCTFEYQKNDDTESGSMNTQIVKYGENWTVPENGFTKTGYEFASYNVYKDGVLKYWGIQPNQSFKIGEGGAITEMGTYIVKPTWNGVGTQLNISASCDNSYCSNTGFTYLVSINGNTAQSYTGEQTINVRYGDTYKITDISLTGHSSNNTEYTGTITSSTITNVNLEFTANTFKTVKHIYEQNADGTYTCVSTDTNNSTKYGNIISAENRTDYDYNATKSNHAQSVTVTEETTIDFYFDRHTYTVTINSGDYINNTTGNGTYRWGENVNISAIIINNTDKYSYSFKNWETDITLNDSNNQNTSFIMPKKNVTIKANGQTNVNSYTQEINVLYQKADGTYDGPYTEKSEKILYDNNYNWEYGQNKGNKYYDINTYYPATYKLNNGNVINFNGNSFEYVVKNNTSPVAVTINRHLLTMIYDFNNGTTGDGNANITRNYLVGAGIDLGYTGVRPGWEFIGWSTKKDTSSTSDILTSYIMPTKEKGSTYYLYAQWKDITAPTVNIDKVNTENKWVKSIYIRANIADEQGNLYEGSHTYSDGNTTSYEYCWSTNNTTPNGEWKTYTPNTDNAIVGNGMTGSYYLFIKRVGDVEIFGHYNWSSNNLYHIYGPYYFDNTAPTSTDIKYNYPNSKTDGINWYEEDKQLTFTIMDDNSGIQRVMLCNIDDVPLATKTYINDTNITASVQKRDIFNNYTFNTEGANLYKLIITDNLGNENVYTFIVKISKTEIVDEQHYAVWKGTTNLDVYANWTPNTYTITYNYNKPIKDNIVPNESNAVDKYKYDEKKAYSKFTISSTQEVTNNTIINKQVIFDGKIGDLPTPSIAGWIFTGWYINGVRIDKNTIYSSYQNETVLAGWKPDTYTIKFDYNKPDISSTPITGNETTEKHVHFNEKYGTLPTPGMNGWTFEGWWTDPEGGEKITPETDYNIIGNTTIYAHWVQNKYIATFDYNYPKTTNDNPGSNCVSGVFGVDSAVARIEMSSKGTATKFSTDATKILLNNTTTIKQLTFDNIIGELPVPSIEGWTFDGWYINNVKVDKNTYYSIYKDITIKARWIQNVYEIRLYADKPSNASNVITNHNPNGWTWNNAGYYFKKIGYDDRYFIPTVNNTYTLKNWTALDDNNERNNECGYWYYKPTIYGNAKSNAYPIQYNNENIGSVKNSKKWNFNSKNGAIINLYAHWDADIFTITLDDYDATSNAEYEILYEKYDTGIFTRLNCAKTNHITNIEALPKKEQRYDGQAHNYHFSGYYTNTLERDIQFISDNGTILWNNNNQFDKDTIIYASWYYKINYNINNNINTNIVGIMSSSRHLYARVEDYADNISYLLKNQYIFTDNKWDFDKWCTVANPLSNDYGIYLNDGQEILNLGDTTLYLIASYTDMYAKQNVSTIDNITGEVSLTNERITTGNISNRWTNAIEIYTNDIALSEGNGLNYAFNTIYQNIKYLPTGASLNAGIKYIPKKAHKILDTSVVSVNEKTNVTGTANGSIIDTDVKTTHISYNIQGRYSVTNNTLFENVRQVTKDKNIKYPTNVTISNNTAGTIKFKLDRTKPILSNLIVSNETLDKKNPDGTYKYKVEDLKNEMINNNLIGTSTISVIASDYNASINGAYKDVNDSSGIQAVYIKITGNDTNDIIYDKLDLIKDGTEKRNAEDSAYIYGRYAKTYNFMTLFPEDTSVKAEIYIVDNAGNTSESIKDISDLTFTTFSIRTVAYSDEDACFNQDINTGDVYFKTGDYGHIEVWTIGYVENVSFNFLSLGDESVKEIVSGLLLPIYNLGSTENGSMYERKVSYTIGSQIIVNTGIANTNSKNIPYAMHYTYKASYDEAVIDNITGNLIYKNRKWCNDGLSIRIPPYYKMKENPSIPNEDGTPSYYPEVHEFIATAHKGTSTKDTTAKFVLWDTRSSDIHYRLYH